MPDLEGMFTEKIVVNGEYIKGDIVRASNIDLRYVIVNGQGSKLVGNWTSQQLMDMSEELKCIALKIGVLNSLDSSLPEA
ncbi:hypothetical protein DFP93_101311 [Aneurinibacillus soli]|uniref:Uncharacterized protein n=1 Tax=Aneurinibacillus soli TaxID=1500254 RepID=A0A0U5AWY4_9BACL|nr:hypothetical protein [Aneurinibacillus soli]PYE64285.1 hypothetical protein DFP93_101311 [Aneurinibacillus soli]BAU28234.1 hypothetical protein CB4_02408 [Aneurinibacillus soli]